MNKKLSKEEKLMGQESELDSRFDVDVEADVWHQLLEDCLAADDDPMEVLANLTSVEAVIQWLFWIGHRCAIKNLRYYHFVEDVGCILVDCAGYSESMASELRYGIRREWDLQHEESFYCARVKKPVVCKADETVHDIEAGPDLSDRIGFARVHDYCELELKCEKDRLYLDVPVIINGRVALKFSCDFHVLDPEALILEEVEAFCRVARIAGVLLDGMQDQAFEEHREKQLGAIHELESTDDLLVYVQEELTQQIRCDIGWFLELRCDVRCRDEITCFLTTPECSKSLKQGDFRYRLDPKSDSLLAWACMLRKALVFDDIRNQSLRERQASAHKLPANIDWSDPIFGDRSHGASVIAIPIISPASDQLTGLLLFCGKRPPATERSELAVFNGLDQSLLDGLAKEGLAGKIDMLRLSVSQRWNPGVLNWAHMERLCQNLKTLPLALIDVLADMFPETHSPKLYVVCQVIEEGREEFLNVLASAGELDKEISADSKISAKYSVTLDAVSASKTDVVFRNVSKPRTRMTPGAVCEMACAVDGPPKERLVLVVKSGTYDLSLEEHGFALQWLASWTSQLLGNADSATSKSVGRQYDK